MAILKFKILPARKKTSGKLGLYLAVSHKKEVRYISTEFEIDDESQFDDGRVCYRKDAAIMNKRMTFVLNQYKEKLDKMDLKKVGSCARLKELLLKEEELVSLTLEELFDRRIERLAKEGRKSYAKMNGESKRVVLEIVGNPSLEYITKDDVRTLCKKMQRKGYSDGGIQIKMAHLKAAINEAIDEGWVKYEEHPFRGFRMPTSDTRLMDITVEEFQAIRDLKTDSKRVAFARDMFLLSFYLGGINMADLVKVDLSGTELRYIRTKTASHKTKDKEILFDIPAEASELIARYAPKGKMVFNTDNDYLLLSRYTYNCFQLLKKELGIKHSFAYYSGRKTFAQFAFMLGIKTEVIEYCVGQSVKRNRPIYNYVRVMKKQANAAIRQVIDYTVEPGKFALYDEL